MNPGAILDIGDDGLYAIHLSLCGITKERQQFLGGF